MTPKNKKVGRKVNNCISALVFSLVFICIVSFMFSGDTDDTGGENVIIVEEVIVVEEIPTVVVEEVVVIGTLAKFETQVRETLGDSNRDVERLTSVEIMAEDTLIVVIWTINDNLFTDYISWGGKRDVGDILEILSNSTLDYEKIQVKGTFSMIDTLGNTEESIVVLAVYPKEVVDNINFENIDLIIDTIYTLAFDGGRIHHQFD